MLAESNNFMKAALNVNAACGYIENAGEGGRGE